MEDLLQSQIRESCKLALPNGLQDLMADISREVLRAQPDNVYQFIADSLSALLVARENLSVAARVCDNVCNAQCWPELEDELREMGLSDEDVEITVEVVTEFFKGGKVEEGNLLLRLFKKTEIEEDQFPAVLAAVRRAFLMHKLNTDMPCDSSSESDLDETARAAKHTLKLYRQSIEPGVDYSDAAKKIQAAYRAYHVRRETREHARDAASKKTADNTEKSIRFNTQMRQLYPESNTVPPHRCSSKASSMSLAGSFITLPPYTPYSNNYSDIVEHEEVAEIETERTNIEYMGNIPDRTAAKEVTKHRDRKKSISFHELDETLYSNCDDATSEANDEAKNVHEKVTNYEASEQSVKIDSTDTKSYMVTEIGGEISDDMINDEIIDEGDINKEMNLETISEDTNIHEEMVNYDASDLEGDIQEEIPNEEASNESTEVNEKVMSLLNHDELMDNEDELEATTGAIDESDDDNDDTPDYYSNKDFNYESSKDTDDP